MINETIIRQKVRCSTQHLIVGVKGGFAYGTEHEICRESASRPIFFSFYLPDPLPFYFSIPLSLSLSRFPPCVQQPSFLCPRNPCSLHEIPQSILTLAVRGRLVRGCWTECRNGDEARGMMRKKKKKDAPRSRLPLLPVYVRFRLLICLLVSALRPSC